MLWSLYGVMYATWCCGWYDVIWLFGYYNCKWYNWCLLLWLLFICTMLFLKCIWSFIGEQLIEFVAIWHVVRHTAVSVKNSAVMSIWYWLPYSQWLSKIMCNLFSLILDWKNYRSSLLLVYICGWNWLFMNMIMLCLWML